MLEHECHRVQIMRETSTPPTHAARPCIRLCATRIIVYVYTTHIITLVTSQVISSACGVACAESGGMRPTFDIADLRRRLLPDMRHLPQMGHVRMSA